ncbi:MAG: hypothetical protein IPH18_09440 [Chitinophagaceae bacterium]|nr:hypothetical protein [Chitinophagaceae bacterium]
MKPYLAIILSIAVSFGSCDTSKSSDKSIKINEDSLAKDNAEAEKIKAAAEASEKTRDRLAKLLPLSETELKALLPETFMESTHTDAEVSSSSGALSATAKYEISDSSAVILTIFDCAGPEGVGIYNMQYLSMVNAEEETDEEYTKPVTVNGNKGMEHCDKTTNDCSITWFSNRFLITLEGENTGAAKLKQAATGLRLK